MKKLWAFLLLRWEWLRNPDNRAKLYDFMKAVAIVLIAAGLVTPDEVAKWFELIGPILLFGSATVAKRHVQ